MLNINELKLLWRMLSIMGCEISGYRLSPYEKWLSFFVKLLSLTLITHWILVSLYRIVFSLQGVMGGYAYILMPIQLLLIWYFLNTKKEILRNIINQLDRYSYRYIRSNTRSNFMNVFIIALVMLPCAISLVITICEEQESLSSPWTFEYKIHHYVLVKIMTFYGNFVYYFCSTFVPLVTLSLSTVLYNWGRVLRRYNKLLRTCLKEKTSKKSCDFLKEFFDIVKILQLLGKILAYPSFILMFYSLEMIFILIYNLIVQKKVTFLLTHIARVMFNGVYGFLIITVYSISSSMIPEQLTEIKKTVNYYLNKYGDDVSISRKIIFCLKRIEKQDIVYISAGGMFMIDRQFILTAFGATLTYDLLIISHM